ncbi:hypothetical protein Btru_015559 [Bulinus truncatus]|nr:hypothetical protein Btru_015559 [Bulinus truncatus]
MSSRSTLFGLTLEDIDRHNPAKHLLSELQQTISPLLEERLQKKCDDIYNFYEPLKSLTPASQRLMSAKSNSLPDVVEQKILCLLQEKEALKKDRYTREQHFWTYYQKLLDCLSVIETIVNNYKLTCQAETDDVTVEWLKIRCDALCLKVKLTQIQILCDTYTNETVKALKKISGYLDEAIQQSESQLSATSYSLQAYHTIGTEFKTLVNQFSLLQNEIENRKWALSTLRKTSADKWGPSSRSQAGNASPQSEDSLQLVSSASRSDIHSHQGSESFASKTDQHERETKKVSFQSTISSREPTK